MMTKADVNNGRNDLRYIAYFTIVKRLHEVHIKDGVWHQLVDSHALEEYVLLNFYNRELPFILALLTAAIYGCEI